MTLFGICRLIHYFDRILTIYNVCLTIQHMSHECLRCSPSYLSLSASCHSCSKWLLTILLISIVCIAPHALWVLIIGHHYQHAHKYLFFILYSFLKSHRGRGPPPEYFIAHLVPVGKYEQFYII